MAEIRIDGTKVREVWIDGVKCKEVYIDGCKIGFEKTWTSNWIGIWTSGMWPDHEPITPTYYDLDLRNIDELIAVGFKFMGGKARGNPGELTNTIQGAGSVNTHIPGQYRGRVTTTTGIQGRASVGTNSSHKVCISPGGCYTGTTTYPVIVSTSVYSQYEYGTASCTGTYINSTTAVTKIYRTYYTTDTQIVLPSGDFQISYFDIGGPGILNEGYVVPQFLNHGGLATIVHPIHGDYYYPTMMLSGFQQGIGNIWRMNFTNINAPDMPTPIYFKIFLWYIGDKEGEAI